MGSDQKRKSARVLVPDELQKTYSQLAEYEPEYQGAISQFLKSDAGFVTVSATIISTLVGGIAASGTSFAWIAALPVAAVTAITSGAEFIKRYRYRYNLQKRKTIIRVSSEIKNFLKSQYELKLLPGKQNKAIVYDLAESILTNATYDPWANWRKSEELFGERFAFYHYRGDFEKHLLNVKNIRTNKELSVGVAYNNENGKITLTVNGDENVLSPKVSSQPIELKTAVSASLISAQKPQLPELNTEQFDFSTFPTSLGEAFKKTVTLYNNLRGSELAVEEAYKAERVVEDLQNAATLYQTIVRFNGANAEETVGNIVQQLHDELQIIADGQLAAAVRRLDEQKMYIESRKESN